ncbi:hypothetical protein ACCO45_011507 [Purpureocillium lilacinum]|uniref:Uncharacterized protein n=1 Tax=Purpureocillium lilacinum TaxID=33203 RepID=A0ACC4DB10_PURLI
MHDDLHDLHDELAGLLPPLRNHGPCGQPQSLRATARLRLSTYAPPLQRQQLLGQLNPITPGAHRGTRASAPVAQAPASRNCWPGQARAYGARGGPWDPGRHSARRHACLAVLARQKPTGTGIDMSPGPSSPVSLTVCSALHRQDPCRGAGPSRGCLFNPLPASSLALTLALGARGKLQAVPGPRFLAATNAGQASLTADRAVAPHQNWKPANKFQRSGVQGPKRRQRSANESVRAHPHPSRCWFERPVALAERRPEELGPALDPVDGMTGPDFNLIMAPYAPPVRTRRRKPSTSPSRMVPPQQFHKHRSTLTADHPGELPLATLSGTATQLHSLNPTLAVCAHSPAP